ncbi:5-formyltetrahydrofolate cyclo-ligase [Mariprofundus ferrinatatus]|uniref:5-formyltetrahydrofolate cyclo-ligase n=1 Tax=Mariprofundus ferrinatatus TaxID=1921087 RepID=A0A2K8L118_9PROT|nr:5-formyltetrahydrofolate cyclo-ligase [Mariprofundus ferrinatatus]ATX80977.1 5-formyltetrahydrofolate cyclo-ligase [Mariprofundus ferrinatatus]
MTSAPQSKDLIRSSALAARRNLSTEERELFSARIRQRLIDHLAAQNTATEVLLAYRAMPSEVDADPLFYLPGFRTFAPVTHHHEHMEWHESTPETRWSHGVFGILEPEAGEIWMGGEGITTLLCPLTAFDRSGNRLGMGKGCFDFWLASHRKHIYQVIGLAFACQEVAGIPEESHDIPMDFVITEQEVIKCQKS